MDILGHPYIAYQVTGRLNSDLVAGSRLPELVPFVPNSVFSFQEIHEGGDLLYKFLKVNNPKKLDLALGVMSHSVKFGADKFNNVIENWLLGKNEKLKDQLAEKIVRCSGVDFKIAKESRIHNYLWAGVDLYLQHQEEKFVQEVANLYRVIDWKEVEIILSEVFNKPVVKVKRMVDFMVKPNEPELLLTLPGLVKIWKGTLAGLPEKDKIKEKETEDLFEEIYFLFRDNWEGIIKKVVEDTKERMAPFI